MGNTNKAVEITDFTVSVRHITLINERKSVIRQIREIRRKHKNSSDEIIAKYAAYCPCKAYNRVFAYLPDSVLDYILYELKRLC